MITDTITVPFSDPAVEVLGEALKRNCTAVYKGERYWVVKAEHNMRRRASIEDSVTFTVTPYLFCHEL